MEGSLNDGLELDDESNPSVSEVMLEVATEDSNEPDCQDGSEVDIFHGGEIQEETDQAISLEARLDDLQYLLTDLEKTCGMTQSFAMEAERILPGFGGVPVGFYTKTPSATRFKVSMEELHKGVWALIGAAIGALIVALSKFFGWFGNAKDAKAAESDLEERMKDNEAHVAALKTSSKAMSEVAKTVKSGVVKVGEGEKAEVVTLHSIIRDLFTDETKYSRAKAFLETHDAIFHDILNKGPYTQAIMKAKPLLNKINDVLKLKVELVEDIAKRDVGSFTVMQKVQSNAALKVAEQPIQLPFQHGQKSLQEVADHLTVVRAEIGREGVHSGLDFDKIVSAVRDAYGNADMIRMYEDLRDAVKLFTRLEDSLEKLQARLGDLSTDGEPGHNTQDIAQRLRDVVHLLQNDVRGYKSLVNELKGYSQYLDKLAREAVGFSNEIGRKITTILEKNNQPLPPELQAFKEESSAKRFGIFQKLTKRHRGQSDEE